MNKNTLQDQHISVSVKNLKVHFPIRQGILGKAAGEVKAVDDVSFDVIKGEVFALVGESGCGKTTTAHAILGLAPQTSGSITFAVGPWKDSPQSWNTLSAADKQIARRHLQVVFQDPYSSLDPRMTVRMILEEPFIIHRLGTKESRTARILELLDQVGLSKSYLNRYPHEFSGGQRQRIGIARALATSPELIVADEPVSALDVSIQAQIINLLQDLQKVYNLTQIFISHDLAVVRHVANRLAVMYLGRLMEMGTEQQIFGQPLHPYTHLLLSSVPVPGKGRLERISEVTEERGAPQSLMQGCPFYPRCPYRSSACLERPQLLDAGEKHLVACFNQQKRL